MKATVSTAAAIIIAAGGVLLATTHADALEVTSAPVGPQPVIVQTLVATPAAATAAPAAAPAPASTPGAVVVQELTAMPAQPTPAQATPAQRVEAPAAKRVEPKSVEAKSVEAPAPVAVVTAAPAPAQPVAAPAPAQPVSAAAPANPATPASETAALEAEVAALVNDERSARGLGHVEVRAEMSAAAHAWSAEMLRRGVMQHSTSVPQFAYNAVIPSGWQWAAENVAVTAGGRGNVAQEFMTMWMNSPGHRENILNPAATSVGVGISTDGDRYYATRIFARY
ncbi:CAP domain-containing protein [Micrococcales bacterium 31B]|nr:CAP domain-containing protein [Micrococcales bacterium 31B]